MEQRLSLVTLGVSDVGRARAFYEEMGWRGQEVEDTVFFHAGTIGVVLWGRDKLAEDSGVDDTRPERLRRHRPSSQRSLAVGGR